MHKPIQLKNIALSFNSKPCFSGFETIIHHGNHIAITGRNGNGKSSLLRMLMGQIDPTEGDLLIQQDIIIGFVPQIIDDYNTFSGGQRFQQKLGEALALNPSILLLDEPTNHLDRSNRRALFNILDRFEGTIIIVSHDVELLQRGFNRLWHIDDQKVTIFSGSYSDYQIEIKRKRSAIESQLDQLDRKKKDAHESLMKEQQRSKKSRAMGKKNIANGKWEAMVADSKRRGAEEATGRKSKSINDQRDSLNAALQDLRLPEIIIPRFCLSTKVISSRDVLSVQNGSIGYDTTLLNNIYMTVGATEKVAIQGDNGSGKSTFIKALRADSSVFRQGEWIVPVQQEIGYLDQHYITLQPSKTVLEIMEEAMPDHDASMIRKHLNNFLFRKNDEISLRVDKLSGGERVRLSLAVIAAQTPRLLILDEITNNLDLETRDHVIQVLKEYPASIIVISHDQDFLQQIGIETTYRCDQGMIYPV
jgi:ATPase subunit of ABC transporter with duplicated ATPase domains